MWLGSDGSETVAIKVFRTGADHARIDAEIEALGRASHRHMVRLDDLSMGPNGVPCLILQRLTQWTLGRLLATGRPATGEAVTILAPLCLALAELHRVGVAHGRVRGGSVLFDDAGAPVLASFGAAQLFGPMPVEETGFSLPPAKLERQLPVAKDLEDLAALCRIVLDPDCSVARWLAQQEAREASSFPRELADRLFQLAEARPVHFASRTAGEASALIPLRVARVFERAPEADHEADEEGATAARTLAAHVSSLLHVPDGVVASVVEWGSKTVEGGPVASVVMRAKVALRPVRKPVWIMAGLVAASVVVATALMPAGTPRAAGTPDKVSPSPAPSAVLRTGSPVLTGDDPLAAAEELLDARTECFELQSVLCLDGVNQQGSAAMDADVALVRLLQEGGASGGTAVSSHEVEGGEQVPRRIAVLERLGESVLLTVSFGDSEAHERGFSLLLIKQEDGWRIRDFVPLTNSAF